MFEKQRSLNLSTFFFFIVLIYRKVSEFIKFETSLRFFSAEFSVKFSFSWIFLIEVHSRLSFNFTFISCRAPFMKLVTKPTCWLKSSCLQFRSPNSYWGSNSSLTRGGRHFLVLHCLGLLLPSPLRPNQVLHVVSLIFFLEMNFYRSVFFFSSRISW